MVTGLLYLSKAGGMSSNELIRSILGDNYLEIGIAGLYIDDNTYGGCTARINIRNSTQSGPIPLVDGSGLGVVDAIFSAFKESFGKEYESLKSIELYDFKVTLTKEKSKHKAWSGVTGAESKCEVELVINNSYGNKFTFTHSSHSVTAGVARGVAQVVEHFVNAERAYIALHGALKDAKKRNRTDLIVRYTKELAEVVKYTSYASIFDRLSEE